MTMTQEIIHHSTVLVTYNHEDYIAECIESVLAQNTQYNFEIVIIDDCSTDKTGEIIKGYLEKYPRKIRYYRSSSNYGVARKALFGLRPEIKGKYWSILEGDDFLTDDKKLETQISFLEENPDFTGCTCGYTVFNSQEKSRIDYRPSLISWTLKEMISGEHSLYSHTSTWVWRNIFASTNTDRFFLHPELEKNYTFGDTCLYYFMANQGGRMFALNETMSCYRITGHGKWTSLSEEEQRGKNQKLYRNIDKITNYQYSDALKSKSMIEYNKNKFISLLRRKTPWLYKLLSTTSKNIYAKKAINSLRKIIMYFTLKSR